MNRCPLSGNRIGDTDWYHPDGLRTLSRSLTDLKPLPYDAEALRQQAALRAHRMSIQGVQPKLSAVLNTRDFQFDIVDFDGRYIIKPPHPLYPNLPENEHLTMRLAETVDIEIPTVGLLWGRDRVLFD